ncbi:hypothetical protein [Amorphus sp. 3PC139-8]|uniref:hypothetical protein n=1 Tax=Amorphus sp. 3PC139-8 TaxID=2735676 RepID=UPI00345CA7F5
MIAIGCLLPLILAVVGGLLAHWFGGMSALPWGFFGGLAIGSCILGVVAWVTAKMKS